MRLGGARRPIRGEDVCGDAYVWWREGCLWTLCVVDGLGHGHEAARAADAAITQAQLLKDLPPPELIAAVDKATRGSRGVAMAVVRVDAANRTLRHAGLGNVRAALFGEQTIRFEGTPGIVGTGERQPLCDVASWQNSDLLILWTDGFSAYLNLDRNGLRLKGTPEALAQKLLAQNAKEHDDAGIVCCLLQEASA